MKKTKKMVCAPIATLTLIGSLIGGANALTLATWSIVNDTTATATLSNGTVVTATASSGGSFTYVTPLFEMGDSDWPKDFGNSFFPNVTAGNGLNLNDGPGSTITFSFSPSESNPELWYANAREDFTLSSAFSAVALDQATVTGTSINNYGTNVSGPDPIQSAGRLTLTGDVSIDVDSSATNELVRFAIVDTVPEPSSSALIGLGGLALLARRKRG